MKLTITAQRAHAIVSGLGPNGGTFELPKEIERRRFTVTLQKLDCWPKKDSSNLPNSRPNRGIILGQADWIKL